MATRSITCSPGRNNPSNGWPEDNSRAHQSGAKWGRERENLWEAPDCCRSFPGTRLSQSSLFLELDGAEIAQCRVPSSRITEGFNVVEHVGLGVVSRSLTFQAVRSVLSEEKKLSIAALAQTLPDRLMEQDANI